MKYIRQMLLVVALCVAARLNAQANAGWESVKRIPADELIRIRSSHRITVCNFERADDESLVCSARRTRFFIPVHSQQFFRRSDVQSVRISRRGISTLTGTVIGLGAGVGIGAAIDASAKDQVEEGHIMAVLFGFFGGLIGSGIGHHTDFLSGPIIYRAS